MYTAIPEPTKKLAKKIVSVMRWRSIINHTIEFIILAVLYSLSVHFEWVQWINWILLISAGLAILSAIWLIGLRPLYIYKNTRYDVNEEFLQLKTGAFNERHELVPMTKIQAVSTNQGPILRRFNLYAIAIETMGSNHGIAGLPKEVAIDLRNQIAHLAKIQEDDD